MQNYGRVNSIQVATGWLDLSKVKYMFNVHRRYFQSSVVRCCHHRAWRIIPFRKLLIQESHMDIGRVLVAIAVAWHIFYFWIDSRHKMLNQMDLVLSACACTLGERSVVRLITSETCKQTDNDIAECVLCCVVCMCPFRIAVEDTAEWDIVYSRHTA